jgi:hypothetical protein
MIGSYKKLQGKLYERMGKAYYNLIISLNNDIILENGLREGLNKFLSNAYLKSIKKKGVNKGYIKAEKHLTSHFISKKAHELMRANNFDFEKLKEQLIFEHIIPKGKVQEQMREGIKNGTKKEKDIIEDLNKYWLIATITKDENDNIKLGKSMPDGWVYSDDIENIRIRYSAQYNKKGEKIEIEENPYLKDLFIEL